MITTATFFLVQWTNSVLVFLHDDVGLAWGGAIVGLTFIARALIVPLSVRQIRSMREMQAIQPHVKEIQERYKDDRERMQREMMRVYQEHGVNPLASCFPLLLQMPVFIALLYTLRSAEFKMDLYAGGGDPGWLFIPNLAQKATGGVLVVLFVLYVSTQIVASLIMTGRQASTQQRMLTFALPFVFGIFMVAFPAGVLVYWIASNVWTMGQQAVVRIFWPPPPQPTPEEVQAAKPPPPPPRKKKRRR